jgi:3-oxoacyl-[acyl-carrier protein] reductase
MAKIEGDMDHSGRLVIITGGSRGIGRAIALQFAVEKAKIIIVHYDPDESAASETVKMVQEMGSEAESHKIDVSSRDNVAAFFKEITSRYGKIDVLVNNAGITRDNLLLRMSEKDWDLVLDVNLKSVFNCTQAVLKPMIKQREGAIVNISSVVGQIGNASQVNYSASKAGIMGFTKSIAREVASRNITINAVAPGYIETEMTALLPEEVKQAFMSQIPLGRLGSTEDVAGAVYWLCSGAARYITGQVIHVNGGMFM